MGEGIGAEELKIEGVCKLIYDLRIYKKIGVTLSASNVFVIA
jgi:hypothetical protein